MTRPRRKPSKHAVLLAALRPQYDELAAEQNGRCAICLREPKTRKLDIDHCHQTYRYRGLLCARCNRALPYWITAEWLRAAADYLERAAEKANAA